jgi:hypothetical protein
MAYIFLFSAIKTGQQTVAERLSITESDTVIVNDFL